MKRILSARLACLPWGGLMWLRRRAYRGGLLSVTPVNVPVLSVGNLALGGTGKSPLVRQLATGGDQLLSGELMLELPDPVAILSRGYGRRSKGWQLVSQAGGPMCSVEEAGDEALMLALQCPQAWVAVCEDRVAGAKRLVELGAGSILLDDAYQHMRIGRDANVLLWRADQDPAASRCLPFGPFREAPSASVDAQAIVFTRGRDTQAVRCADWFHALFAAKGKPPPPMFRMRQDFAGLHSSAGERLVEDGQPFGLFSGIGDPGQLEEMLRSAGKRPVFVELFPDHYPYSQKDLARLESRMEREGCGMLVTTWKDRVKLPQQLNFPLAIVEQQCRLEKWS